MSKSLNLKIEEAIRLLSKHMEPANENSRKPVLFHDIRVGTYLYENGYSEDIVLAGFLHDTIEWSDITEDIIKDKFGEEVLKLVLASTKDDSISDKKEKAKELIERCVKNGQEALIVKAADIIDSFKWYSSQNNEEQLLNHCLKNADLILTKKPATFGDKIFNELTAWKEKFKHLKK